ncbi:hypothetical protein CW705_04965 [Candidatus Bathyarchaeota archaeon]|nr:MAG: hypothetical protein CW705_04965 [Candidatus Bathyarchaeota archaeon]
MGENNYREIKQRYLDYSLATLERRFLWLKESEQRGSMNFFLQIYLYFYYLFHFSHSILCASIPFYSAIKLKSLNHLRIFIRLFLSTKRSLKDNGKTILQ